MKSTQRGKPCYRRALLLLAVALSLQVSRAQTSETTAPANPPSSVPAAESTSTHTSLGAGREARHPHQNPTLDDRIAVLSKNLELTDTQRTAVKRILLRRQQETLRIRNSDEPGNLRIGQFRALQDHTVNEIRLVLTEEQKKKYDPMTVRQLPAPSTPQRSVEDWIKATTPK